MRRPAIAAAWVIAIMLGATAPREGMAQGRREITPAQVDQSIKLSVAYLRGKQDKVRGSWQYPGNEAGMTGLATLALLSAGVPANDPAVEQALRYLTDRGDIGVTYDTALQTMAFCAANPEKYRAQIRRNVQWLQNAQTAGGSWSYRMGEGLGAGDNSNTQFALLALHEAQRSGVEVNPQTWRKSLAHWLGCQNQDGGFGYTHGHVSTGSMTCAGISSLVIASGKLTDGDAKVVNGKVQCCGEQMSDLPLEQAIAWLTARFSVQRNPSRDFLIGEGNWMYYMYGLERAGRLTGRRFFGEHDWYREGAEVLVAKQNADGSWNSDNGTTVGAALGVLFLAKGQRPIVISKYQHADLSPQWDPHRSGIPHLTAYVEKVWKRDLSWQVVAGKSARTEDLLESPILFLSGRQNLFLTPAQKNALKAYVEQGGFIFAEKACGGEDFDRAFRALMQELFPESPLRSLRPDHPVWYAEERVDAKFVQPVLEGIDACCRTSVVYSTRDLSCFWELDFEDRQQQRPYPPEVLEEIRACRAIGLNVISYATGRQLKNKLDKPIVVTRKAEETLFRETLAMTKLAHAGGADDAPNALGNLLGYLTAETEMRTKVDAGVVNPTDPKLADYPMVFVHGRRAFEWSAAERKALRTYVERGGIVVADAICGNPAFAESFRREWELIFPEAKFGRLPKEHPLFSKEFEGFDIGQVSYRKPLEGARAELTQGAPQIEAMEWEGRLAVIFSPLDLSCALENSKSPDCIGYIKEDAIRIGINLILYCLQQ